jgi:hypothetical protein
MYLEFRDDFDVDDIFDSMSKKEKKEMMELLCEHFEIKNPLITSGVIKKKSYDEIVLEENCAKLTSNYISLTSQDLEIIGKIASKFI